MPTQLTGKRKKTIEKISGYWRMPTSMEFVELKKEVGEAKALGLYEDAAKLVDPGAMIN